MKKKITTFCILSFLITVTIYVINRLLFSINKIKNTMHEEENLYYEWRFGKIKYQKKGNGNPLLLIHDLKPGSSSYEYTNVFNELSKNHEVFSIDLLGYGLSEKSNLTYTNYLYVQLILDFIKNIIGRRTDIIVSGESASIVTMAVHNDSEKTNQIIMINPENISKLNKIPTTQTKALKLLFDTPVIGTLIYHIVNNNHHTKKLFNHEYFYNNENIKEGYIESYLESLHTPDYKAKYSFASYKARYMNANICHALQEINHSITILYSEELDSTINSAASYALLNPSIETMGIKNVKLLMHLEKPELVMEQLNLFLK